MTIRIENNSGGSGASGNQWPKAAADLTEAKSHTGTLTAGTYTRAQVIALIGDGATKLLSLSATVATGTATWAQGGTVTNLPTASIVDRPYNVGFSLDDFTLTVNASSTVYLQARGI
jgi:hypothetical protein